MKTIEVMSFSEWKKAVGDDFLRGKYEDGLLRLSFSNPTVMCVKEIVCNETSDNWTDKGPLMMKSDVIAALETMIATLKDIATDRVVLDVSDGVFELHVMTPHKFTEAGFAGFCEDSYIRYIRDRQMNVTPTFIDD